MSTFVGIGWLTGIGLLLMARGLSPARAGSTGASARSDPYEDVKRRSGGSTQGWWRSLFAGTGEVLAGGIWRLKASTTSLEQDLAMCGRTREQHGLTTALAALGGLTMTALLAAARSALGAHVPLVAVVTAAACGGGAGAVVVTSRLRRSARAGRQAFLRALSCWLELVALGQAAGMGIESAIDAASGISSDRPFGLIRGALEKARHAGRTPWDGIRRLGDLLGLDELGDLGTSIGLAGTEGARIRASLRAKSSALRLRLRCQAEARENSATERLFLPSVVLMLGFLVFLIYPAGVSLTRVV